MNITNTSTSVSTHDFSLNGEWHVAGTEAEWAITYLDVEHERGYSHVIFTLHLKRRYKFYVMNNNNNNNNNDYNSNIIIIIIITIVVVVLVVIFLQVLRHEHCTAVRHVEPYSSTVLDFFVLGSFISSSTTA